MSKDTSAVLSMKAIVGGFGLVAAKYTIDEVTEEEYYAEWDKATMQLEALMQQRELAARIDELSGLEKHYSPRDDYAIYPAIENRIKELECQQTEVASLENQTIIDVKTHYIVVSDDASEEVVREATRIKAESLKAGLSIDDIRVVKVSELKLERQQTVAMKGGEDAKR